MDEMNRHLLDLCRRSDRIGDWAFSGFLSPAEQADFLRCPEVGGYSFSFHGGYEAAERKIMIAGSEAQIGYPAAPPICVIAVEPVSVKFAEDLTHRDYLGAILNLGIERSLTGDILIREHQAWFYCLDSAADYLTANLTRVRKTSVAARVCDAGAPDVQIQYEELRVNVASERLDAILSAFCGVSRGQVVSLFSAEKVFVNGRVVMDKSARLKEGDIVSVRGFGRAIYDGIEHETRKNRLWVKLRKPV